MRVTRDVLLMLINLWLSIVSFCVDFKEGGKPEYPKKNPRSTGEIICGNSLAYTKRHAPDLVSVVRSTTR